MRQVRTYYVQNDALAADVDLRSADIVRAQAELARAQSDVSRRQQLAKSGGVSGEEILHAEAALKSRSPAWPRPRPRWPPRAKLATNQALTRGTDVAGHPDVQQAVAGLRNAWLAQSRTVLPAPVGGVVARRSARSASVSPGRRADDRGAAGSGVGGSQLQEGQLRKMRIGQPVKMNADLYGTSVTYHGTIAGLDAGTGSAFALLPAQNATGKLDQGGAARARAHHARSEDLKKHPLRVGLSMEVEVDVGKRDGEPLTQAERKEPAWSHPRI